MYRKMFDNLILYHAFVSKYRNNSYHWMHFVNKFKFVPIKIHVNFHNNLFHTIPCRLKYAVFFRSHVRPVYHSDVSINMPDVLILVTR